MVDQLNFGLTPSHCMLSPRRHKLPPALLYAWDFEFAVIFDCLPPLSELTLSRVGFTMFFKHTTK